MLTIYLAPESLSLSLLTTAVPVPSWSIPPTVTFQRPGGRSYLSDSPRQRLEALSFTKAAAKHLREAPERTEPCRDVPAGGSALSPRAQVQPRARWQAHVRGEGKSGPGLSRFQPRVPAAGGSRDRRRTPVLEHVTQARGRSGRRRGGTHAARVRSLNPVLMDRRRSG